MTKLQNMTNAYVIVVIYFKLGPQNWFTTMKFCKPPENLMSYFRIFVGRMNHFEKVWPVHLRFMKITEEYFNFKRAYIYLCIYLIKLQW